MLEGTGYIALFQSLSSDLVKHGWGELTFKVQTLKDSTARVDIMCGRQYVFFIKKEIDYNKTIL